MTISNLDQLKSVRKLNKTLKVHVKIDTGMNRLGFKNIDHIVDSFNKLKLLSDKIIIEGIYTHFSTADVDKLYYDIQMRRFREVLDVLEFDFTTHIRLGISLYGLSLDQGTDFLEPAFKLISHISEIKHLSKGDKVGYGATYVSAEDELIGVLPIGYADGFIRKNQCGKVEINGIEFPIIGRICMDQMFIKIDEKIMKTDDVVLFGGLISIDDVAKRLETINYEVVCQISYRVPRIYIK